MTGAHHGGSSTEPPAEALASSIPVPEEVLRNVLALLDLRDLRAAAAVGRRFYDAAWGAGLYIQRNFQGQFSRKIEAQMADWTDLVDHALRKDLRLALALDFTRSQYYLEGPVCSYILEMISLASKSLPVLLALSITVPELMFYETRTFLQRPAPRLRSFSFSIIRDGRYTLIPRLAGLFSDYAPNLREVELHFPLADTCALPSFANVVRLSAINWKSSPSVAMSLHFPKLKHLYVLTLSDEPEILPRSIDLSGVTLSSLAFNDARGHRDMHLLPSVLTGVSTEIPVLHYFCPNEDFMDWGKPLAWPGTARGSLNLRLRGPSHKMNMLVAPSDHSWRRSYIFGYFDSETPLPLSEIPGLSARLEYLRLDATLLHSFLQCDATLSAMRRLRIDVPAARALFERLTASWCRPVTCADWSVRCPALGVLALAAVHEPIAGDVALQQSDVVMLVSALRLSSKPALELCAVTVDVPVGQLYATTLSDVFSSVSSVSAMPCVRFDSAVWDDNDALVEEKYNRQSLAR